MPICKLCKKSISPQTKSQLCRSCCKKDRLHPLFGHILISKNKLFELYIIRHLNILKIKKLTKISYSSLYNYLLKFNIPIRPNKWKKGNKIGKSTRFKKGHKFISGGEKGWFKKGKDYTMMIKQRNKILKKLWNNSEFRNKTLSKMRKYHSPNKSEIKLKTLLNDLFPKIYSFVGNGKFIIGGYNPDFIDLKNKKIIELFGDYHHNLPKVKKRDNRKLKIYRKFGYKTLIIWSNELNNITSLITKLKKFKNG